MSKVICDVCGTTYPETSAQCPICGSAKKSTAQTAAGGGRDQAYAYVKGGRFSKANVRKRNKKGVELERRPAGNRSGKNSSNGALIAIVILLIIAIIGVLGYMGIRVFLSGITSGDNTKPTTPTISTTVPTTPTEPVVIPCTGITLARASIEFTAAGDAQLLSWTLTPADTTDAVTFATSDEKVATVSEKGLITAVGGGEAVITITCGQMQAQCQVVCSFEAVTEPTEPSEPEVTVPAGYELKLKHKDITLSKKYPDPVGLYVKNESVKATDITWTVDDPTIATVDENGVVTAVGRGNTVVHATIGDQTVSCKVNVSFDPEPVQQNKYKLSKTDVTLKVGESFSIYLTDSEGVNVEVEWEASIEGYVEIRERSVKAIKSTAEVAGKCITLIATVEGETYKCTVRIVEPTE